MATQLQTMRSQIEQLQTELLFYRGDASAPYDELQVFHCVNISSLAPLLCVYCL